MVDTAWFKTADVSALSPEGIRTLVREEMATRSVLRLRRARFDADPKSFWRWVGDAIGFASDIIEDSVTGLPTLASEGWMDVRFEPDRPDSYRHHKVAQPLHSDGAYSAASHAQSLALFYLERQAQAGGDSLFIDAESVGRRALELDPTLYEALTSLPVHFGKAGAPGRTSTILYISQGRHKINWNYFRVLPYQGEEIDRLRERFHAFLDAMIEANAVNTFRLDDGDAVFFRDDEVLHGRKHFEAVESGDRLLWKTYFVPRFQAA